ncbi:SRPBCC family protein [Alkalicoccus daliensis]|uniref:Ligand-binding SRPBCC domain-containing protein n=1 Tax=Alkalicoccus daliensis TaxID=745820 RepID=A0A1H0B1W4_9BACI|nr:hypothetical protein [Alkalicoccus daliensis]SDN39575.1 Ligand-binding SRPBCC domain-containing protein [Alkalicoccus daliensis]
MFTGTFHFKTEIDKPLEQVWNFFQSNENLVAITGFPKISLLGDKEVFEGADIQLKMNFIFMKLHWQGEITEVADHSYFIDEGKKLPFPFKSWKHVHAFKEKDAETTIMYDRVEFESYLPAPFINLMLTGMFKDRKRQLNGVLGKVR